jgi:tRNA (guanine37-N1)-methyltransferase
MFDALLNYSIFKRALTQKIISADIYNIRDFAQGKHHITDDKPYGGGSGMILKAEPVVATIDAVKQKCSDVLTILLSPQGKTFDQQMAQDLSQEKALLFICGRYEGVDERIALDYIDLEISVGNFVLTGGEPAAILMMDAISRLIPGVLGADDAAELDSFSNGLLEHAHYTRPENVNGHHVPDILLSGHHKNIAKWRQESSLIRTLLKHPALFDSLLLSSDDLLIIKKWAAIIETIIEKQSSHSTASLSGTGKNR